MGQCIENRSSMSAERDDCEGSGLNEITGGSVDLGGWRSVEINTRTSVMPGMAGSGLGGMGDGSPHRRNSKSVALGVTTTTS